jgi:EF hand
MRKTLKTRNTLIRFAAILSISLSAMAMQGQTPATAATTDPLAGLSTEQAKFFRYFDADQDGKITREEYRNVVVRFFEQMDRKHHGWVDDKEIRQAFPAVHAGQPIDPKLRLSLTQFEDFMMARFDRADDDHTGWLTPKQFVALQHIPG